MADFAVTGRGSRAPCTNLVGRRVKGMEYDVNVYRDGRWWMIEVPSIDARTQARRVSAIKDQAVSLIATYLDVPLSQVEIKVVSMKIDEVDALALVEHVKAAREAAAEAEAQRARRLEKQCGRSP